MDEEKANTEIDNTQAKPDDWEKLYRVLYPVEGLEIEEEYSGSLLTEEGYNISFLLRSGHLEEMV